MLFPSTDQSKDTAKALYSYTAQKDDELSFTVGDSITVLEMEEEGWWRGRVGSATGWFPHNYVELTRDRKDSFAN